MNPDEKLAELRRAHEAEIKRLKEEVIETNRALRAEWADSRDAELFSLQLSERLVNRWAAGPKPGTGGPEIG